MADEAHGTRSGFRSGCRCEPCVEAKRAYDRDYYATRNREKKIAQVKAWRAANPEKARAISSAQYWRDPAKAQQMNKAAAAKNPDVARAAGRRYRTSEHGRVALAVKAARRRGLVTDEFTSEYIALLLNDPCAYCGAPAGTVDHIIPVSQGGTSEHHNLTAACLSCNASKRDQSMLAFMLRAS